MARSRYQFSTYRIRDESLVLLEAGAASIGDAVEPVRRRNVLVSVSAHAVDAEHEEGAHDGRDAGGEKRGGVFARAVVDPA